MNIGILGSGDVAKSLAAGFLAHGHKTMLGTRHPAKLKDWAAQNPKGAIGSFADAPPTNGVLKFFTNLDESLMSGCSVNSPACGS